MVEQIEIKLGLGNSDLEREIKFFTPRKDENNRNLEYRFDYGYWYYPKWGSEIGYDDHVFKAIIKIENECQATLQILENHGDKTEEVLREELIVRQDNHNLHILKKEHY